MEVQAVLNSRQDVRARKNTVFTTYRCSSLAWRQNAIVLTLFQNLAEILICMNLLDSLYAVLQTGRLFQVH